MTRGGGCLRPPPTSRARSPAARDLAALIPDHLLPRFRLGGSSSLQVPRLEGIDPDVMRYVVAYKDVDFGWKFCDTVARNHLQFPALFDREDDVLFRAWLMLVHPAAGRDPLLKMALALTTTEMAQQRMTLKALLLAKDATINSVAAMLRMDPDVVRIFEKLFFNVIDRKNDLSYLQSILFPEGRGVELNPNYLRAEHREKLLLRAGRKSGAEEVLYWSGASEDALEILAATKSTSELENTMTGFGLLLARYGGLNQSGRDLPGMSAARQVVAAAKMSGEQSEGSIFDLQMGTAIKDEIRLNRIPVRFLEENTPQIEVRGL